MSLKPNRVVPLALLAARQPSVLARMRLMLDDPQGEPYAGLFVLRPFASRADTTRRGSMPARRRSSTS